MARLELDQVNVVVPDMPVAVAFLRELGADVPQMSGRWDEWNAHHLELPLAAGGMSADLDSAAFASHWGGLARDFGGVVVNLRTPERGAVDACFDHAVELGAEALRPPYDAFWGARYAVVRGPGPVVVGLMSPVDPARRSPTPDLSDFA